MKVRQFNSDNIYEMHDISKTIRDQIGRVTMLACGAREFKILGIGNGKEKPGLQFRVNRGSRRQFIKVILEPNDTYTVIIYRLKRITDEHIDIVDLYDIYCDQLSEVIYCLVNKR